MNICMIQVRDSFLEVIDNIQLVNEDVLVSSQDTKNTSNRYVVVFLL